MKWYHGSEKDFSKIDFDKLRHGDYGKGLYLTDNPMLAYSYSGRKNVYEVTLNINPMTTSEKILAMNKASSRLEKDAIKSAPLKEMKDKRGATIAVVKYSTQIVVIKKLDAELFKNEHLNSNNNFSL